jgi:hypothetical protein
MYIPFNEIPLIDKESVKLLLTAGFQYIPEVHLNSTSTDYPAFRQLAGLQHKANIKIEYVHLFEEYDPVLDRRYIHRSGYCFVLSINDIPVMSYRQIIPSQQNVFAKSQHSTPIVRSKTEFIGSMFKTKEPTKHLFKFFANKTDAQVHAFNEQIFMYLRKIHYFNDEFVKKKDKTLFILRTFPDNDNKWFQQSVTKVKTKKINTIRARKEHIRLMGDKQSFIANPEWFTSEGIDPINTQETVIYTA